MTRVAIVGAGRMAREHAAAFADVPDVELVGIHTRTRAHAEALATERGDLGTVCDSIEELAALGADLVVVTVTETAAREVALATLAAHDWTLLLEKPPGLDVSETEAIARAAEGRRCYVGLNRQWISATRSVLDELQTFDGPRTVIVEDAQDLAVADALGYDARIKSHWMYANSIHLLDYFRYLTRGDVTKVTPVVPWDAAAPNHVVAKLEFDSGDIGIYRAVWNAPGPWAVSVFVPGHRWELRPLERAVTQRADERPGREMPVHQWDHDFKPGFRLQAQHAVAGAKGEDCPLPSIRDALGVMRTVEAIYPEPAR